MVDALPGRVAQAEAAPLPHLEFLELLVEDELARRADRLFARRLKQAGITVMKTLAIQPIANHVSGLRPSGYGT
jgi:hypothetical protein